MRGAIPTPKPSTAVPVTTTSLDGSGADEHTPKPTTRGAELSTKTLTPSPTSTSTSMRRPATSSSTDVRSIESGSRASSSYLFAGSSSRGSSSSASFSFDPDTVGNDPGWTKDFPCQFYPPDADGCAEYRSCYDCLNGGIVYKGRGCYVNSVGRCLPLATADFSKTTELDFRKANASTNATRAATKAPPLYFPSRAAKYCAMSDPACQRCRRTVFQNVIEYDAAVGRSNYCVGHNSCVCVAVCEAPSRADVLGGLMCNGKPLPGHSGSSNQASSQANRAGLNVDANITWLVGVPMFGLVMAVMLVSWTRKHRRAPARELPRDVSLFGDRPFSSTSDLSDTSSASMSSASMSSIDENELPPSSTGIDPGRALRLPGWRALRNELIEREQQLIAGRQDFSSIGYVQLLDTSSSSAATSSTTSEDGRESDEERHLYGHDHHHHDATAAPRRSGRAIDAQTLAVSTSGESDDDDDAVDALVTRHHRSSSTDARDLSVL